LRKFIDLHLIPQFGNFEKVNAIIKKAAELGYYGVGLTLTPQSHKNYLSNLKKACKREGLDLITRVDLKPRDVRGLLKELRAVRRRFEIIAVKCHSKSVARQAAKDRRVDILNFPSNDLKRRFFDKAEAKLASNANASLEIDMTPLITCTTRHMVNLLDKLRREIEIAKKFDVKIIISSGASNPKLMRAPRDYVSLASLFDLERDLAVKALSDNPLMIIEENRMKLSKNFIAPGFYLIKRGKDD